MDARAGNAHVVWASSLTRLLQLLGRPDGSGYALGQPFVILTAFRAGEPLTNNRARQRELAAALAKQEVETYVLVGHWLQVPEGSTPEEARHDDRLVRVREESLFGQARDADTIERAMRRLGSASYQGTCIMSNGAAVWLQYSDSTIAPIGTRITVRDLEQAYRRMRVQRHVFRFV